ncbi:hypothetical protein AB0B45_41190 [Nonomuraea sp. NPDC049152]
MATARLLYLTRHGEASPDESGLTENGRRPVDRWTGFPPELRI